MRKILAKAVYAAGLVAGCALMAVTTLMDLVRPGTTGRCHKWIERRLQDEKDKSGL